MVLQNSGRYKPEKGNPFSAGTSQGVGNSETSNLPGDDGQTDKRFETTKENEAIDVKSVSYTHLTLPTILRV